MKNQIILGSLAALVMSSAAMALPVMTANSFYGANDDGSVIYSERWNTIAPHPAWDVYVSEGAIPGSSVLNNQDTEATTGKDINHQLVMGDNTFTFAVSHQPDDQGGDLALDYYGFNVFLNGKPITLDEEAPQISAFVATDRDGPGGVDHDHQSNTAGATMGFPLADLAGAGLTWTDGEHIVTMTDYFVYGKYDADGNDNAPDFDVMPTGSHAGRFLPDGNQDVVGQYTLNVAIPEPSSLLLLVLGSLTCLLRRR